MMAIIGIGLDIVELKRIELALVRFGSRFLARVFAPQEHDALPEAMTPPSPRTIAYIAARFSAKEAAVKALGTGFSNGIAPSDIVVSSLPSGKPALHLLGKAKQQAELLGVHVMHLTLTHSRDNAAAVVILEGK